jgi:hypothetical protein
MRKAIQRSGYLIEHRIATAFDQANFFVSPNAPYPDPKTGISRELDISAITAYPLKRDAGEFVFPVVLCECENNPQPFVVFESADLPHRWDREMWKVSGVPAVVQSKIGEGISLAEALKLESFHHYWSLPTGTQYCTFQKKKSAPSDWMALHSDDQHDSFGSLINALEAEIDEHFGSYRPPPPTRREELNLNIYYLLLVLRGDIYLARPGKRGVALSPRQHVCYLRSVWTSDRRADYQIDIIDEAYISSYLALIDRETATLVARLKPRRRVLETALERLTSAARDADNGSNKVSWRKLLTDPLNVEEQAATLARLDVPDMAKGRGQSNLSRDA